MQNREREILTEFIELYCDLRCLWDMGSDSYKDRNQKSQSWQLLADILRDIEPGANIALAKKKIEHMRTAYKREAIKIKESKTTGSGASDVHVPNLWYFQLLNPVFENKIKLSRTGVDLLTNDEESQLSQAGQNTEENTEAKKRFPKDRGLERKKHKLIETAQELLQKDDKKPNSFGIYVGEQLEQVNTFQRQVAEKLISEVLFLAKTGNLYFETKIASPSGSRGSFSLSNNTSNSQSHSPQYILPSDSPHYIKSPSPKNIRTDSPQYIRSSPSPQYNHTSSSFQFNQPSSSRQFIPPSSVSNNDEGIVESSIDPSLYSVPTEENHTSTTILYSSPQNILSSSSPQYIRSSSSHPPQSSHTSSASRVIQPSSRQFIPPSSASQILTTIENDGTLQLSLPERDTSLYSERVEENHTSRTIYEGPANSVLKEFLIIKKAK